MWNENRTDWKQIISWLVQAAFTACSPTRLFCTALDNWLHRPNSLACSPTRPLCAVPANWLHRPHSLACSPTGPLCVAKDSWLHREQLLPAVHRTTLCISADWLPRHSTVSSRLPYLYIWPTAAQTQHDPGNPPAQPHSSPAHQSHRSLSSSSPKPSLPQGGDTRTPTRQQPLYHTAHLLPLSLHTSSNCFSSQQLSPCSTL